MDLVTILPLLLIGVVFYFLVIRPQKNRQRQQAEMLKNLTPGTEIMTTAGVFGTIAWVNDDTYGIEVAPGVTMRMLPAAIAKVVTPVIPEAIDPTPDTNAE